MGMVGLLWDEGEGDEDTEEEPSKERRQGNERVQAKQVGV